jgi:hypothetical protein
MAHGMDKNARRYLQGPGEAIKEIIWTRVILQSIDALAI